MTGSGRERSCEGSPGHIQEIKHVNLELMGKEMWRPGYGNCWHIHGNGSCVDGIKKKEPRRSPDFKDG